MRNYIWYYMEIYGISAQLYGNVGDENMRTVMNVSWHSLANQ